MQPVGFVGLGLMGGPMAANLLKAGFDVTVYNRTAGKARALLEAGARVATVPGDVAAPGGIVVSMLADDNVLEALTAGADGFGERLGPGGLHLSMSTVSPQTSVRLAAWHAQRGSQYVAAPVFGRPPAAAAAKMWIVQSGEAAAKARARPVLEAMGQGLFDFGPDPGAANVVKLAGNFLIGCVLEGLAEAQTLAEKNGVERKALADFLAQTIFACPVYQNYAPVIAAGHSEQVLFLLRLGLKDVRLVQQIAAASHTPMPFANVVHDRLASAVAKGRGEMDWTALGLNVSEDAGLRPGGQ
jgi:3-hydroxyisobutyrate dehydrogenase-like beta-hydroxyacid dehydrogenase